MTNPTNAVEKPATGCGCEQDAGVLCVTGAVLDATRAVAYRRHSVAIDHRDRLENALRTAQAEYEAACVEYDRAREAYRAHLEAA